ncbi:MAG: hypothetical protein ACREP1_02185, partial [Rhodanobacteraceae bacterium]
QLELVDWDKVYFRVLEKKRLRQWGNAVIRPGGLREIMANGCEIIADDAFFDIADSAARRCLQEAVCEALETYFERYYRLQQNRFETRNLAACRVREAPAIYPSYRIQVKLDQTALIAEIEALAKQLRAGRAPDWESLAALRNIPFERHLYQPLLMDDADTPPKFELSPPGLEKTEREFVAALKEYWRREQDGFFRNRKLFLLRNQSRGKGLGFYESHGFFPDFILWLVEGTRQRILFIDPHGLMLEARSSDKLDDFHDKLAGYVKLGLEKAKLRDISVDGWILSSTSISDLRKQWDVKWNEAEFARQHILFVGVDYPRALKLMLGDKS